MATINITRADYHGEWNYTIQPSNRSKTAVIPDKPFALIPLVILWFGIEEEAKLFLVALGVFFPIYVNTLHGVRSVDPQLDRDGRGVYGMSRCDAVSPRDPAGRAAVDLRRAALRARHHVADPDRRRDHLAASGIGYMAMQAREFLLVDVVVLGDPIYALLGKLADASRARWKRVPRLEPRLPDE